jgi:hypothetical protein
MFQPRALLAVLLPVVVGVLAFLYTSPSAQELMSSRYLRAFSALPAFLTSNKLSGFSTSTNMPKRTPVYYFSHGGVSSTPEPA